MWQCLPSVLDYKWGCHFYYSSSRTSRSVQLRSPFSWDMAPDQRITSVGHFQTMKGAYVQVSKCPTVLCYMSTHEKWDHCVVSKWAPSPSNAASLLDKGRLHLQCFNCEISLSQTIYVYLLAYKWSSSSLNLT